MHSLESLFCNELDWSVLYLSTLIDDDEIELKNIVSEPCLYIAKGGESLEKINIDS